MACSSSCQSGDHRSYGECLRSKNLRTAVSIPGNGHDRSREKAWESRIDSYRSAKEQGIQPASSRSSDIRQAVEHSNKTGQAFIAQ